MAKPNKPISNLLASATSFVKNNKLISVGIAVVALAVLSGVAFGVFGGSSSAPSPSPSPTPPSQTRPDTTEPTASPDADPVEANARKTTSPTSTTTPTPSPAQVESPQIVLSDRTVSASTAGLTQIDFTGIYDGGYGGESQTPGILDDSFVPMPLNGNDFYFFGVNHGQANNIFWNSNNALTFGPVFNTSIVSINHNTGPAILLGNYDRLLSDIYYTNTVTSDNKYKIYRMIVKFSDYYTDTANLDAGIYQIRLIKENAGAKRQWVEVSIISSPPSPGYSNNPAVSYPTGVNGLGQPQDSNGLAIDPTKDSPYNITSGTASSFLNPFGSLYSTASPAAGTSFILQSDELGNTWTFTEHAYLNI
jgi:hypothetical protein